MNLKHLFSYAISKLYKARAADREYNKQQQNISDGIIIKSWNPKSNLKNNRQQIAKCVTFKGEKFRGGIERRGKLIYNF